MVLGLFWFVEGVPFPSSLCQKNFYNNNLVNDNRHIHTNNRGTAPRSLCLFACTPNIHCVARSFFTLTGAFSDTHATLYIACVPISLVRDESS